MLRARDEDASAPVDEPATGGCKRIRVEAAEAESRVGMTCSSVRHMWGTEVPYVPFTASLKTLFSDFVVREMSPTVNGGQPLRLTSLNVVASEASSRGDAKRGSQAPMSIFSADEIAQVQAVFGPLIAPEDWVLLDSMLQHPDGDSRSLTLQPIADKQARVKVHQAVKDYLKSAFVSSTDNGRVMIQRATNQLLREQSRRGQAKDAPQFVHFTLYKENLDSSAALRSIAQQLGISAKQLRFGGTKDKRGVTLQRVSCRNVDPQRLLKLNMGRYGRNAILKVGDIEMRKEDLNLGDLGGNYFEIVLRVVQPLTADAAPVSINSDVLARAENILKSTGFVNYFGPQRFGTTSILTSDVGRAMLRGAFDEALLLVVKSRAEVSPELAPTVSLLEQALQDALVDSSAAASKVADAVSKTPHYCFQERDMLKHLGSNVKDPRGCFLVIPRTMSMLYIHSVQSLIWNAMVSRRLTQEGYQPVVGDLVLAQTTPVPANDIGDGEEVSETEATPDVAGPLPSVKHLTEADISEGRYRLTDVLLTVPGPDPALIFPTNTSASKDHYLQTMHQLQCAALLDDPLGLARLFHFHGTYRPIAIVPLDLHVSCTTIKHFRQPVLVTDLELIREAKRTRDFEARTKAAQTNTDTQEDRGDAADEKEEITKGTSDLTEESVVPATEAEQAKLTDEGQTAGGEAVVLRFGLPPGTYATSLLREICHVVKE